MAALDFGSLARCQDQWLGLCAYIVDTPYRRFNVLVSYNSVIEIRQLPDERLVNDTQLLAPVQQHCQWPFITPP